MSCGGAALRAGRQEALPQRGDALNSLHLNARDLKPCFHCRACKLAPWNFFSVAASLTLVWAHSHSFCKAEVMVNTESTLDTLIHIWSFDKCSHDPFAISKIWFGFFWGSVFWSTDFVRGLQKWEVPAPVIDNKCIFRFLRLSWLINVDVVLHFWHFQVFESSRWQRPLQRPALDRQILPRSLENPFVFFIPPTHPASSPAPGCNNTLLSNVFSRCARGAALPGGVRDNPKTNGGTSINTWSQDGQEVLPELYITVVNNRSMHSDP